MVGFRAKDGTVMVLLSPIPGFLQPPSSPNPLDFGLRGKKKDISFLRKLWEIHIHPPQPIVNIFGNNPLPVLPPQPANSFNKKDLKDVIHRGRWHFPQNSTKSSPAHGLWEEGDRSAEQRP